MVLTSARRCRYPDSLWQLWLVNTPMVFRVVWSFIAPMIDPVVKAKVRMMNGKDQYLREMEKCGLMPENVPVELGGTCEQRELITVLEQIVAENKEKAAAAASAAAAAEVTPEPLVPAGTL